MTKAEADKLWPTLREQLQILVDGKQATGAEIGKAVMPWLSDNDNAAGATVSRWLHGHGSPEPRAESTLRLQQFVRDQTGQCPCCGRQLEGHFTP